MWEAISDILNSSNGSTVIVVFLVCVLIAFVMVKGGFLQVHTNAIKIGARDSERNVIRQQQDYVWQHLTTAEKKLRKKIDGYDKRLGLIIVQAAYIEYCTWIAQNHLTMNESYIELKQQKLVDVVGQYTEKEEFQTDEFIDYIRQDTKETICQLIDIREIYKDK